MRFPLRLDAAGTVALPAGRRQAVTAAARHAQGEWLGGPITYPVYT
jgi:hypothetical protein